MKCPICSAKISDTDAFCPNCGSAVKSETSGYMDSIDTSNLGENVGFGKRNTTGAQPVNAVPQQNYAQGQQSYGQPQNGYAQQSYPPPLSRVIRLRRMAMLKLHTAVHMSLIK